jgi:hypothetical protein
MTRYSAWTVVLLLSGALPAWAGDSAKTVISWKKTVVDRAFRSEGVAVADVNKDGKLDIIVGDVWYEAPDWKVHVIRKDRTFDPRNYSESFGVFAEDFNGDGYPDVLILPFPGRPCTWCENPGAKGGPWKEHVLSPSACNETPQFVDLFGTGKRVLIMGVQPKGQSNMGQMFWLRPGKDPTQLWEHHPISEPSKPGKIIPGTFQFSHGLGVGDVNGDGRLDVLTTQGWWEQPEELDDQPWKFHPAPLGPDCADMHVFDIDGDGKNDVITSSAHGFGLWWHQQKPGKDHPAFFQHEMLPGLHALADKKNYRLVPEEKRIYDLINYVRADKALPSLRAVPVLCRLARAQAEQQEVPNPYPATAKTARYVLKGAIDLAEFLVTNRELVGPWTEMGISYFPGKDGKSTPTCVVILGNGQTSPRNGIGVWDGMKKQFFSQSHALHFVDINGDGRKDLVTGRRWWAHGPKGDAAPTEPAFIFWLEAKKGKDGITTFVPHVIDDDSGIGTQFAVHDINGDGLLDVIVSNKHGVFIFQQVRSPQDPAAPRPKE